MYWALEGDREVYLDKSLKFTIAFEFEIVLDLLCFEKQGSWRQAPNMQCESIIFHECSQITMMGTMGQPFLEVTQMLKVVQCHSHTGLGDCLLTPYPPNNQ